jgi:cystathionine gamma-synthase
MTEGSVSRETLAAQALGEVDPVSGGLAPLINTATNYEQQPDGSYRQGRVYTRADNPTFEHAERLLAALEGAAGCVLFASGMAAATAVFQALLPGDHVLVSRVLYWGVRKWLAETVDLFCGTARDVLADMDAAAELEALIEAEPGLRQQLSERFAP